MSRRTMEEISSSRMRNIIHGEDIHNNIPLTVDVAKMANLKEFHEATTFSN
jgi:hypothetical protein